MAELVELPRSEPERVRTVPDPPQLSPEVGLAVHVWKLATWRAARMTAVNSDVSVA